jgi:NADPH:quinone reductase-like Zn-dependent oxidoreductase/acyl carrier protein
VAGVAVGDEVIAVAPASFSTFAIADASLVVRKPATITFDAAVALPVAYLSAAYGLQSLAQLRAGERVLIHAATGGVGLAGIQLARRAGAEIIATAGSERKRNFLRAMGVSHVFDSRSAQFASGIVDRFGPRAVDVVLNSLSGDLLVESIRLLRPGGRFVDLSKPGTSGSTPDVPSDVTYARFDLGDVSRTRPQLVRELLLDIVAGVASGALGALPCRTHPITDAVRAFRTMAQARHIGKLVLSTTAEQTSAVAFAADATYLITGGTGGLGLTTAAWMAERGARHLVLASRREAGTTAQTAIAALRARGVETAVICADVSRADDVAGLLKHIASTLPPLRGIVHAAGVLDDGIVLQQTPDQFSRVLAPKVAGAWHLHAQTLQRPIDFFVMYSSAASVLGSPGQSNHAAANAFLDGLAHHRRQQGLPALSIDWGIWSDVGSASGAEVSARALPLGIRAMPPQQGLAVLDRVMRRRHPQVAALPVQWTTFSRQWEGSRTPSFLSELIVPRTSGSMAATPAETQATTRPWTSGSAADRKRALMAHVHDQIRRVLGWEATRRLDPKQPFQELGLDSLMAVELRNALGQTLGRTLPATLVFDYPTLESLGGFLTRELVPEEELAAPAVVDDDQALVDVAARIDQLSEEEAEALLLQKLTETSDALPAPEKESSAV